DSKEYRTEKMVERLKTMTPCQILHLQEVWSSNQAKYFLKNLENYEKTSAPNLKFRLGLMGFYKGRGLGSQTHIFPLNNDGGLLDGLRESFSVLKGFQVESIQLGKSEEPVYFLNTHLHPTSVGVRLAQILELYSWRRQHPQQKVILTGDFNFEAKSLEKRILMILFGLQDSAEQVIEGYPHKICTYCHENPLRWLSGNHIFDYIFYSNRGGHPQKKLTPLRGEVNFKADDGEFLSDHYGLRIQFQWSPLNNSENGFSQKVMSPNENQQVLKDLMIMNKILRNEPDYFIHYQKQAESIYRSFLEKQGEAWEFYLNNNSNVL
ncbi:MAG TPA: endonuclease/exonuclease/phosphatase family protein, partial [Pseudobdellovibrionaceae bacterium]|nr:endonuclease/exonuclease/phosphatase family protein [Pseudobdellovibrionaceae bacterium]